MFADNSGCYLDRLQPSVGFEIFTEFSIRDLARTRLDTSNFRRTLDEHFRRPFCFLCIPDYRVLQHGFITDSATDRWTEPIEYGGVIVGVPISARTRGHNGEQVSARSVGALRVFIV